MRKPHGVTGIVLFAVALLLLGARSPRAEITILLTNGKTVSVPVHRDEIVSISFVEGSRAPSGVTWDFESGDLRGWTATGEAFATQPTFGDNPTARHRGQPSKHQGSYWIGGYENRNRATDPPGRVQGDGPQGTLTSDPFRIEGPRISFLIGGGCDINTERAELLINGEPVLKATGRCDETLQRQTWDVSPYLGRTAQFRLVDASGGGWGHINFDDVRFE